MQPVHLDDTVVRILVLRVRLVRSDRFGYTSGLRIRSAGHERSEGRGVTPAFVGVVGKTALHEERAKVRVAKAQLAMRPRVLGDFRSGVVGIADEDLLCGEDDLDRGAEPRYVELGVAVHEAKQIQ